MLLGRGCVKKAREHSGHARRATAAPLRDSWTSLAILAGVLALATLLEATPREASLAGLRAPPCALRAVLGEHACPGCGLTRSTSLVVRGDLAGSLSVHPAGALVALLCLAGIALHLHILIRRRRTATHAALLRLGGRLFVLGLVAACVVRWI